MPMISSMAMGVLNRAQSHKIVISIVVIYFYPQCKLHSVKTILGTSIRVGCSNQMQVAQGQDLH